MMIPGNNGTRNKNKLRVSLLNYHCMSQNTVISRQSYQSVGRFKVKMLKNVLVI